MRKIKFSHEYERVWEVDEEDEKAICTSRVKKTISVSSRREKFLLG
jgi:hypothetical protein